MGSEIASSFRGFPAKSRKLEGVFDLDFRVWALSALLWLGE